MSMPRYLPESWRELIRNRNRDPLLAGGAVNLKDDAHQRWELEILEIGIVRNQTGRVRNVYGDLIDASREPLHRSHFGRDTIGVELVDEHVHRKLGHRIAL